MRYKENPSPWSTRKQIPSEINGQNAQLEHSDPPIDGQKCLVVMAGTAMGNVLRASPPVPEHGRDGHGTPPVTHLPTSSIGSNGREVESVPSDLGLRY